MAQKKIILAVYGEGGHEAQLARLMLKLSPLIKCDIITMTDSKKNHCWSKDKVFLPELRDKEKHDIIGMIRRVKSILGVLSNMKKKYYVSSICSTGPGIAILASLYFKIFSSTQIIYIETWSRFSSKSLTGRFMYFFADVFYIQNKELQPLYPKAIYSGRL
jgi:hypothetical protein